MPKKPAPKMRPDVNETAYRVMLEATGQAPKTDPTKRPKNADAVARGSKGGKKGGKASEKAHFGPPVKYSAQSRIYSVGSPSVGKRVND